MVNIKDEIDAILNEEQNLSFSTLFWVIFMIVLIIGIFAPRIYIKNQIYYNSLDISNLYHQYIILKEENRNLKLKIEKAKFENEKIEP